MSNKRPTYCWDTTVFVAWLHEEESAPLGNIDLVIAEIDRGDANLLVSVTTISEILEAHYTSEQIGRFREFLKRSNVQVADVTQAIAEKGSEIRNRALKATPSRKLKTPDAQILATAIVYKADVAHTLEVGQLPNLSGTPIVDGLTICSPIPIVGQRSILDPTTHT